MDFDPRVLNEAVRGRGGTELRKGVLSTAAPYKSLRAAGIRAVTVGAGQAKCTGLRGPT